MIVVIARNDPRAEKVEEKDPAKKPASISQICFEVKTPQLNWQAADEKFACWLNDINRGLALKHDACPMWQPWPQQPYQQFQLPPIAKPVWRP